MRRCIGLDVHREFAEVAIWDCRAVADGRKLLHVNRGSRRVSTGRISPCTLAAGALGPAAPAGKSARIRARADPGTRSPHLPGMIRTRLLQRSVSEAGGG